MSQTGAPCDFCGVRPDVDCRRRPGVERPPAPELPERRVRDCTGNGYNFRKRTFRNGPPA